MMVMVMVMVMVMWTGIVIGLVMVMVMGLVVMVMVMGLVVMVMVMGGDGVGDGDGDCDRFGDGDGDGDGVGDGDGDGDGDNDNDEGNRGDSEGDGDGYLGDETGMVIPESSHHILDELERSRSVFVIFLCRYRLFSGGFRMLSDGSVFAFFNQQSTNCVMKSLRIKSTKTAQQISSRSAFISRQRTQQLRNP